MDERQKRFYDFMVELREKQVDYVTNKISNYISQPIKNKAVEQFKKTLEDVLNKEDMNKALEDCLKVDPLIKLGIKAKEGAKKDVIKEVVKFKFLADWVLIGDMWNYFKDKEINEQGYKNYVKSRCPTKEMFIQLLTKASDGIKKIMESKDFDVDTVKANKYILKSVPGLVGESFKLINDFETLFFGNAIDKLRETFGFSSLKLTKDILKGLISYYSLKIIELYKECVKNEANEIYGNS